MLALKHVAAAVIGFGIATVVVIDTAEARRGGGGSGVRGGGGGGRIGNVGGGGRFANVGGGGRFANVSHPIAGRPDIGRPGRPDIGRPGRPDAGLPGRPGNRPGWGGGGNWGNWGNYRPGYGWGAAAVGAGLAYGAYNNYCDPYDPYYASSGYCSYGRYAPMSYSYGYAPGYSAYGYAPGYSGGYWGNRWGVGRRW